MNVVNGKCVICLENTFVFSGKDKQKFVELLKEHYFDTTQINNNKFLLQFKEKRIEKSICICCAYVIKCYVDLIDKFQDFQFKNDRKCSICHIGSNLTSGTHELIADANTLMKNIHQDNKVRRLTRLCLDCCFSIVSWSKIKNIISQYSQNEPNQKNETSKRRYSLDDDFNSESNTPEEMVVTPARKSRRMSVVSERRKQYDTSNGTIKENKTSRIQETPRKKKFTLEINVMDKLKHLSTVSDEIYSTDIYVSGNMKHKIESDDRMMNDIPYVSCETNDLEMLITKKMSGTDSEDEYSYSLTQRNKNRQNKQKKIRTSRKRNIVSKDFDTMSDDVNADGDSLQKGRVSRTTRKKSKVTKNMNSSVILISDTESENSDTQQTTRSTRRKRKSLSYKDKNEYNYKAYNECTICNKQFVKKYKFKLHELEHEASFTPVVLIKKENVCNDNINENNNTTKNKESNDKTDSNDETNNEEIRNKLDTLVKQVVDDALTQIENEIGKNIINQVVDDTLSQLENQIQENKDSAGKENVTDSSLATDGKVNNENIKADKEQEPDNCDETDKNTTNINQSEVPEIENIENNVDLSPVKETESVDNVTSSKDTQELTTSEDVQKIDETVSEDSGNENKKLTEKNSEIKEDSCHTRDELNSTVDEITVPNDTDNTVKNDLEQGNKLSKDNEIIEKSNKISCINDDSNIETNKKNYSKLDTTNNEQIENDTEIYVDDSHKSVPSNTQREIAEEKINKLDNIKESSKENKPIEENISTETEEEIVITETEGEEIVITETEEVNVCLETEVIVGRETEAEHNFVNDEELVNTENESKETNVSEEKTSNKVDCVEQNSSNENKTNEENTSFSENEETNCVLEDENSDIESLQVSPDCISPKNKTKLNDKTSPTIKNSTNNDDKYEIENILQNLGA